MGIEVAIAAAVVSTIAASNNARAAGQAQQNAYKYNADVNETNIPS